jgi:hypothetical protein
MTLSLETEMAFNQAIEAAYKMQEVGQVYGLQSEQMSQANWEYRRLMDKYYVMNENDRREQWWDKRCKEQPACDECKCFDL